MANNQGLLSNSALPSKIKRTTQSQEVVCILQNCHPDLHWQQKASHLSEHMRRLKNGGYGARYRTEVLKTGLKGYRKMVSVQEAGGRRVNRADSDSSKARKEKKVLIKSIWHRRNGHSTVMFVPATPGSELADMIRAQEEKNNQGRSWRVKIVERAGRTVKTFLQKSDPTPTQHCSNNNCMLCRTGTYGACSRENITYMITCGHQDCGKDRDQYCGESSNRASIRAGQHQAALDKGKEDSSTASESMEEPHRTSR